MTGKERLARTEARERENDERSQDKEGETMMEGVLSDYAQKQKQR